MTLTFKARVPKITEDDILLNTPLPIRPEDITWVWRRKGLRAQDIMNIEMLDKNLCIITYWNYEEDKPAKFVVKEPFDDIMLKWEIAEASNVVFEDVEEPENHDNNLSQDSDED